MVSPAKKSDTQIAKATFLRWDNNLSDQLSTIPVIKDSTLQNSVSTPKTKSMAKNRMAQMKLPGKLKTNSG